MEQHKSDESNSTSFNLTLSDVSDIIGNISTIPLESKKSKVRKRPGAPPIPEPAIISDSDDVSEVHCITCENLKLKNSTVSPRKGAFNPPPNNDLSKLNNSFPIIDKSEFSGNNSVPVIDKSELRGNNSVPIIDKPKFGVSNQTANNNETISKVNKTDTSTLQKSSVSDMKSIKESNATSVKDNETLHMFNIITTTAVPTPTPKNIESSNSSVVRINDTSADIVGNNLDTNSSLTTVKNDLYNMTLSSKKPFTSAVGGNNNKTNAWTIVGAILIVLTLCSFVGYVAYKRLYAYWDRRHYSRMDFLIDGLYEM